MNPKYYSIVHFLRISSKYIYPVLSIIFIFMLSIINSYTSLYNKTTGIKTRIVIYILWIANIKETDINIKTYANTKRRK